MSTLTSRILGIVAVTLGGAAVMFSSDPAGSLAGLQRGAVALGVVLAWSGACLGVGGALLGRGSLARMFCLGLAVDKCLVKFDVSATLLFSYLVFESFC